ncbi:hypothetical protein L873DRAFT_100476 [Choiromyces venosus 120613-1]|uniref:Uncharacterized protein n=1 Tax=Choiromyces venosus 120613-1 TaxID=1336337 RepID=A0A3N4K376_9PEZI|nr:hypothetical protein L873DRAFT_100476 [Choiromyces venosus 120613-1]
MLSLEKKQQSKLASTLFLSNTRLIRCCLSGNTNQHGCNRKLKSLTSRIFSTNCESPLTIPESRQQSSECFQVSRPSSLTLCIRRFETFRESLGCIFPASYWRITCKLLVWPVPSVITAITPSEATVLSDKSTTKASITIKMRGLPMGCVPWVLIMYFSQLFSRASYQEHPSQYTSVQKVLEHP